MNLRDTGIEWHSDEMGLTLWLHPGSSFGKLSIVNSTLNRELPYDDNAEKTGDHTVNNFRSTFLIADAFVLDYEVTGDSQHPIIDYFRQRSAMNISHNLALFMHCLSYEDVSFLFKAFNATRPGEAETVKDTPAKKKRSVDAS